jgi:hypothetical protein
MQSFLQADSSGASFTYLSYEIWASESSRYYVTKDTARPARLSSTLEATFNTSHLCASFQHIAPK